MKNSAFDFSDYKTIEDMASLKNDNLEGYNAYFIKQDNTKALGSIKDITSGRVLDVYSTMPGILFYTGDFLADPFLPFQGLCLESQYYPDGVNHNDFQSCILLPHQERTDIITYSFR